MARIIAAGTLGMLVSVLTAGEAAKFKQTGEETEIFALTNLERKNAGKPLLKLNPVLSKIARAHSANMARQEKMEHKLDGKTPFDRVKQSSYKFNAVGENIAMVEEGAKLTELMQGWMRSKGHKENILAPEYTEIGVGIALAKDGSVYFTQLFAMPRK